MADSNDPERTRSASYIWFVYQGYRGTKEPITFPNATLKGKKHPLRFTYGLTFGVRASLIEGVGKLIFLNEEYTLLKADVEDLISRSVECV